MDVRPDQACAECIAPLPAHRCLSVRTNVSPNKLRCMECLRAEIIHLACSAISTLEIGFLFPCAIIKRTT